MILAHMSAAQSEAIFRLVILAAFVLLLAFLVVNILLMWAAAKLIARRPLTERIESPPLKFQFSVKTLLSLMAVVAGSAFLMRLSPPGDVQIMLVLGLGCWLVSFAVITWALAKTFTHKLGVLARPLIGSGAVAGASAAAFQAILMPAPLLARLYYICVLAVGGGIGGLVLGLFYFAVARWTTKSR